MSHAALLLYCVAFVSMFPHEGTGGWIPNPRYESADSVRITAPTSIIATTMSSGSTFGKNLAWGAKVGEQTALFTHMAVPVMTRLRLPERELLDTLVRSGVARSRSHALAWCVRLVAKNESSWISELKEALSKVGDVRSQGPLN